MKIKNTKQKKRIVTEDKKERFKEIVADNKEFEGLVGKFIENKINPRVDNKKSASKVKNDKSNNEQH